MQTQINRSQLLQELELVEPGLAPKEIIDQSSCFIFKDGYVTTYNDEVAATHECCLNIEAAIQAKGLLEILRKLNEDTLTITIEEGELLFKGKGRRLGLTVDAEIRLPIDSIEQPEKWKKLPENFCEALGMVQQCAGKDESRFDLTCVHLAKAWIEACDGLHLMRYSIKTGIKASILVRRTSIRHIVTLGMVGISETTQWVHFKNRGGLILSCRRYVEEYPDLTGVFEVGETTSMTLPKGLVEAAERAQVFSSENVADDDVLIELRSGRLMIEGRGLTGWFQEVKKVTFAGAPLKFKISPAMLSELVKAHRECEIGEDKLKVDGDGFVYVTSLGTVEDAVPAKKKSKAKAGPAPAEDEEAEDDDIPF